MEAVNSFWFNAQFALNRAPLVLRLKTFNYQIIKPAVVVDFETEYYHVKTADTADEIAQMLSLRFEVFFREFSTQKITFSLFPYDIDLHDFICDHLIVKNKMTQQVVACYRLLADNGGKKNRHFYSESEFILDDFLKIPGHKLELGRACVHKDYRKGPVMSLLWRGLLDYAKKSETRYMFGCSSITRPHFKNFPQIMKWLRGSGSLIEDCPIGIRPKYSLEQHKSVDLKFEPEEMEAGPSGKVLNSLMHMYLMAGAKMASIPAYDAEMDCLDMFTYIDIEKIPRSFERKFS